MSKELRSARSKARAATAGNATAATLAHIAATAFCNNGYSTSDPRSTIYDPRLSTLAPRPSILDPRSSTLGPRPSTLDLRPSTLDPRPSTLHPRPSTLGILSTAFLLIVVQGCTSGPLPAAEEEPQWYRGNLHTHSLWSDGDDYPEMIIDWYREQNYDFLAISDHNTIQDGDKWINVPDSGKGFRAYQAYLAEFGDEWVETRQNENRLQVRLKRYDEFTPRFAEPGRFLLIRSEEISDGYDGKPIHVNATNIQEYIEPQGGNSVLEVMQNNVDAVLEQRERTGVDMFPHLNHPNFVYAVTPEDLIALEGEKFFEVYNGHPLVNNHGDHEHPSTEEMWDLVLAHRLVEGREIMYGLATDDAHHYHEMQQNRSNPGRGWVMVRADSLETRAIINALERGDFYASTGVTLRDVRVEGDSLHIVIDAEPGTTYRTQFVGTRIGALENQGLIGEVLAEVEGESASYRIGDDLLYLRARVISSQPKLHGQAPDEREMAWSQPVLRSN